MSRPGSPLPGLAFFNRLRTDKKFETYPTTFRHPQSYVNYSRHQPRLIFCLDHVQTVGKTCYAHQVQAMRMIVTKHTVFLRVEANIDTRNMHRAYTEEWS